jgi:hypothetical protein
MHAGENQPPSRDSRAREPNQPANTQREPSLAHNLGSFFGHIVAAIKTPVDAPVPKPSPTPQGVAPVGRKEKIESVPQPDGSVLLRRTIIEEVRVDATTGTSGGTGVRAEPRSHKPDDSGRTSASHERTR